MATDGMSDDVRVLDRLLGDFNWVHALARRLAGDGGEDLAQEAWIAAVRAPPHIEGSARPWFAQVLRHLIHTSRRNASRRQQREADFHQALPSVETAVNEVYERLELHRFIAEAVMALEPDLRVVVVLRYFEGLDSMRIGALVGSPAGTVRRRLMRAHAQLRTALDGRFGGRRVAWVALLAPGSKGAGSAVATALLMAQAKTKVILAGAGLLLLLLVLAGMYYTGSGWRSGPSGGGSPLTSTGEDRKDGPPHDRAARTERSVPGPFLSNPAEALSDCWRALSSKSGELRAREAEAAGLVPRAAFESGSANPALRDQVVPQIDRIFQGANPASRPAYHVECRSWACRLTVVVSYEDTGEVGPWMQTLGSWLPKMNLERLRIDPPSPLGVAAQWASTKPTRDLLARRKVEESVFFFGAPAGASRQAPDDVNLPPPTTLDACRGGLEATDERLRRILLELAGHRPSAAVFAGGPERRELAAEVQAVVDRRLGPQIAAVSCQGGVCRLRFGQPPDPALMERLRADPELKARMRKQQVVGRDLFLSLGDDGQTTIARLLKPTRVPSFFSGCPSPEKPGRILLRLLVPATGSANDDGSPGRASVRILGGELADTASGRCLYERVAGVVTTQDLPDPVGGGLRFESWIWQPGESPELAPPS